MRVLKVLVVISLVMLPPYLYLIWSLPSTLERVLTTGLFLLMLSFPFFRQGQFFTRLIFFSMGLLTFILTFAVVKDLLHFLGFKLSTLYIYCASIMALFLGGMIARRPHLKTHRLPYSSLSPDLENLSIVQISDLHVGPSIGEHFVSQVVEKVNALRPDIIVLTGDIGDGDWNTYAQAANPLKNLRAALGIFYVTGNHEYYWGAEEWIMGLSRLGITPLINDGVVIQCNSTPILISGVTDPVSHQRPDVKAALSKGAESAFKILLAHRPGFAGEAAQLGYDLQLSGHTHGGQFFPWTLGVRFFHRHTKGLHRVENLWLNVNVGTGSWGPLVRLGTRSEITQLYLTRAPS